MKGGVWINRRQLRWLLVLLALLPLLPTVLMVRMMLDSAQRERDVAVSEASSVYRDQLARYLDRYSLAVEADSGRAWSERDAEALAGYARRIFGDGVSARAESANGRISAEAGGPVTRDAMVARIADGAFENWLVHLDGYVELPDSIDENLHDTYRKAAMIIAAVLVVAGLCYFVVSRRIRVDGLKADLMSTVSHEMKTPLASMRVMLETLSDGAVSDEAQRDEYHRILLQENHRLARLAEQFLTSSRLERGEVHLPLASVDVGDLLREVQMSMAPRATGRGMHIEIQCDADGPVAVRANRDALLAVLGNLVDNAIKYGAENSTVVLAAGASGARDGRVVIAVRDRGEILKPDEAKRIFERFYQADDRLARRGGGVGLGLSIARKLTELMAGVVGWNATADGNSFFVELPAAVAELSPDPEREISISHG